jgi:hypothetical protein
VSLIKLRENALHEMPGIDPIPETYLWTERTAPRERTVALVGFPVGLREDYDTSQPVMMILCTHLKECAASAHAGDGEDWSAASDFHVDWPQARAELTSDEQALFHPGGLSGGALWRFHAHEEQAWTPLRCARLLGVPWFYEPASDCIRAVPARELLALMQY